MKPLGKMKRKISFWGYLYLKLYQLPMETILIIYLFEMVFLLIIRFFKFDSMWSFLEKQTYHLLTLPIYIPQTTYQRLQNILLSQVKFMVPCTILWQHIQLNWDLLHLQGNLKSGLNQNQQLLHDIMNLEVNYLA